MFEVGKKSWGDVGKVKRVERYNYSIYINHLTHKLFTRRKGW
jgi:hypothetical protein